jgi:hypothetical protein
MDASLSRQFLRLKRSGVKPHTWLANHMDMLSLLVPERDLQRVLQANGEWEGVADSIKNLMESSVVGKTVFSFCSQLVNASHYKMLLERMLADIKRDGWSEIAIDLYRGEAQKAADSFKAMGFIPACLPCSFCNALDLCILISSCRLLLAWPASLSIQIVHGGSYQVLCSYCFC